MICLDILVKDKEQHQEACLDMSLVDVSVQGGVSFDVKIMERGEDGKTPIKGEDYFTEDDIENMLDELGTLQGLEKISEEEILRLF